MRRVPVAAWCALPMFAYASGVTLVALHGWSFLALFELVAVAAPAAVWFVESTRLPSASLSFTAAGLCFVALGILSPSSTLVRQLLAGLLAGLPLAFSATIVLLARRPAMGMLATTAGAAVSLGLRQAVLNDPGGVGGLAPSVWRTGSSQFSGLSQIAQGASSVYLPLSSVSDPVLLTLVLLALVGALLGVLLPSLTAAEEQSDGTEGPIRPPWVELFPSVVAATVAAAGVDLIAVVSPRTTLFVISGAALLVSLLTVTLARSRSTVPLRTPRGASVGPEHQPP